MQEQITAIKQLLEINDITASQIDEILVKALGQQASWENCSTMCELAELEESWGDQPEIPLEIRWIWGLLWRSRIDLKGAKHHAELIDLEGFTTQILSLEKQLKERDRTISVLDTEVDSLRMDVKERDQRISLLKTQVKGFEAALELANSKAIAPNLDVFKGAVDEAVNSALFEKIAERDREIEVLKADKKLFIVSHNHIISQMDVEIQKLQKRLQTRDKQIESLVAYVDQKDSIVNELKADVEERDREIERLSASMQYFDESGKATYKPEFNKSAFERLEYWDLSDWTEENKSFMSCMMKMAFNDGIDVGKAEVKQNLDGIYKAIDIFMENGNQDL